MADFGTRGYSALTWGCEARNSTRIASLEGRAAIKGLTCTNADLQV
jgi:hypothetical protein